MHWLLVWLICSTSFGLGLHQLKQAFQRDPHNPLIVRHLMQTYQRLNRPRDVLDSAIWLNQRKKLSPAALSQAIRAAMQTQRIALGVELCRSHPKHPDCQRFHQSISAAELEWLMESSPKSSLALLRQRGLFALEPAQSRGIGQLLLELQYPLLAALLGVESESLSPSKRCSLRYAQSASPACVGQAIYALGERKRPKSEREKAESLLAEGVLRYLAGGRGELHSFLRRSLALMPESLAREVASQWAMKVFEGRSESVLIRVDPSNREP